MKEQFTRLKYLIGQDKLDILANSKVAIFGLGGVGGNVVDALVRSGIGYFILVDNDVVSITNLNRQLIASLKTIGQDKVEVMKEHILNINPNAKVITYKNFILKEDSLPKELKDVDYVIDAIDTITAKLTIIEFCYKNNIKIISCMGTGNKLDPKMLEIVDISKTSVCPLAKVIRHELKKRNINHLKVCYSKETPLKPNIPKNEKIVPGSSAFVPPVAGILIACEVIKELMENYA